jgi:branched-chain amino acid aminotransferase
MPTVFLDGSFLTPDDARLAVFDAALQHGVGLFETLLGVRGEGGVRLLHADAHAARLRESAVSLGLAGAVHAPALIEALHRTLQRAADDLPDASRFRVRLTLTGGDLNLLPRAGGGPHRPTLLIVAQPATEYPHAMFEQGVLATLADLKVNPLDPSAGHKTCNYWMRLRELQSASSKGAAEALVFSITNHLAGGCVSNAFIVRGGVLFTPIARGEEQDAAGPDPPGDTPAPRRHGAVLPSPVLPGVVRRWVLDWALAEGVEARTRMLALDDVLTADEVFLTNSSWGVLPVTALEAHAIGGGRVGPVAARLRRAWRDLTADATRL